MPKYILIYCLAFLGIFGIANAQGGRSYKEIGVMAGPVFFQSDFGARDTFENYYRNNGISIGLFYYLSTIESYDQLKENFKLRLELSYMKANLNHYGVWVDPANDGIFANQLRAMSGKVEATNFGFQVEYYPFKTDDYNRGVNFSPYLSAGAQVSSTSSNTTSPTVLPLKYQNGAISSGSIVVGSLTTSIGARYLLDDFSALSLDARVQWYMSDWVDGLNPSTSLYPENKSNDWSTTINFGYIYYFD